MLETTPNDLDRSIVSRELGGFVPPRVFDAHAHFYDERHFSSPPEMSAAGLPSAGWDAYLRLIAPILPDRELSGLFFAMPSPDLDIAGANDFTLEEVRRDERSRMQLLITPATPTDDIERQIADPRIVGLKVYHYYADCKPTFDAPIAAMITEEQLAVADSHGLTITLHMVRQRAIADPVNQNALRDYARRFPNIRWILAHAARGFNIYDLLDGIDSIRDLENMYCDTSAIAEADALGIVIEAFGTQRVMYGSDFPVSHERGRCVTIADSFLWLSPENVDTKAPYGEVKMCWIGVEALRAHRLACRRLRLTDTEVEDLFCNNATRLLCLDD